MNKAKYEQLYLPNPEPLRAGSGQYAEAARRGATIPFISRYRKEATGGLDEVQIAAIDTAHKKLVELEKRKETILATIEEQGKLSDELRARIARCMDATELEDIYCPISPSAAPVPRWHAPKAWSRWPRC